LFLSVGFTAGRNANALRPSTPDDRSGESVRISGMTFVIRIGGSNRAMDFTTLLEGLQRIFGEDADNVSNAFSVSILRKV
jgi:hypothetical protein